jgi:hypothetical protein
VGLVWSNGIKSSKKVVAGKVDVTELARNLIGFSGFCVHELNRQVLKLENRMQTPDMIFNLKQLLKQQQCFFA